MITYNGKGTKEGVIKDLSTNLKADPKVAKEVAVLPDVKAFVEALIEAVPSNGCDVSVNGNVGAANTNLNIRISHQNIIV